MGFRDLIFMSLPERVKKDWATRAMANDVGFTGHGKTPLDRDVLPLGRFAHWVCKPAIEELRVAHQEAWRSAVIEVTSEDPTEW